MPSVQRFLSGCNSLAALPAASVQASSVRPSAAIRQQSAQRQGGGRITLEGSYRGHEGCTVDIEIADGGNTLRASRPQFTGVGNGTLDVLAVDAAAPQQTLTFTCTDLGVPTQHATLDILGVQLRARVAGDAGNGIRVTVTERLTMARTQWALPDTWAASTPTQTGEQWNFGAAPLTSRGEVPEDAPRLRFGLDPTVYRQVREYKDGAWHYSFSPALERDLPKDALVTLVSGGYDIEVSDGSATETYEGVVTFYEMLERLAASVLVEVAGVAAADRAPGGMAARDVPLRTSAWLLRADSGLQDVSVPAGAPTQTVTLRCVDAQAGGRETWSVTGSVSGALPDATSGEAYRSAAINFRIPVRRAVAEAAAAAAGSSTVGEVCCGGEWRWAYNPSGRSEDEGIPSVCITPFKLGVRAQPKSVTFRYAKRPPAECDWRTMPRPIIPMRYLGYEDDMDIENAELRQRLEAIYEYRRGFCLANTVIKESQTLAGEDGTMAWCFKCSVNIVRNGTVKLEGFFVSDSDYKTKEAAQLAAARARGVTIAAGTQVGDVVDCNGIPLRLEGAHLSRSDDTSPLPEGATVWGTQESLCIKVTGWSGFTYEERVALTGFDEVSPVSYSAWANDLNFMEGAIAIAIECLSQIYEHDAALALWDALWLKIKADMTCITPESKDLASSAAADGRFMDRWRAEADCILLSAGILPKSSANSDAGGCWRDTGDSHWWEDTSGYYMPAFTNAAYVSCRRNPETDKIESTQEFGFGLIVACPERLKEGDSITIDIQTAEAEDGTRAHATGDEYSLQTVAAAPAQLAGGVTGDDRQVWSVQGSVSGALPQLEVPTTGAAAADYAAAGVQVRLALGGIPHALGDMFAFDVEAGQWRWKYAGGDWSAQQDIPPEGTAPLAEGLAVRFEPGAAPSFVPGDASSFEVRQPWAVSHLLGADSAPWGWEGEDADATIDLGAAQRIECVALSGYSLPEGAQVHLDYSEDGQAWGSAQMDISRAVSVLWLGEVARYLRLRVLNAPGGHIGWLWAGEPLALDHHASQCTRRRQWAVTRSDGINAGSLFAGTGEGWQLAWQPGDAASSRLLQGDIERLLPLLEHAARTDEPLIFIPHHLHPEEASLVRFEQDALEISDEHEWQPDSMEGRMLSATLALEPVYA